MPQMPPPTDPTDQSLILATRAGDEHSFRVLYRRHTPRLLQLVLRVVGGSADDADDVVQESWIAAVAGLERFRWEASFRTWLTGIAINRCRVLLKKRGRWAELDEETTLLLQAPAGPGGDRIDLERAIGLLPPGYRTVLVLHDIEGFTHEEIGSLLGVATGTSKAQLFHARRALRVLLEPDANTRKHTETPDAARC
jgi:RNA polymerase sigma-70 factor, ECF subfamily